MKKTTKTYLLLAVVALIWGTIGYRILFSMPSDTEENKMQAPISFKPLSLKKKETFSISANYRDPFMGTITPKASKKKISKPKTPPVPEIAILFTGIIAEKSSKEKIFFITINGQQHMMSMNDEIQGVKLIKGASTSITVRYHKKTRTIQLQE